ncbi:hypothetical protein LTR37_011678 [Vermiconidia calcicola]|uniref:Uncharacterized protein n=1 Tax=Vermiconidia calcicola TaxID=1690605 RepID=A0ACC3N1M1_9PEZI|nr:hypothetical protein LTR37_011678 [Vermiconidia calcicola]
MSNQQQNTQQHSPPTMNPKEDTTPTTTKPATSFHRPEDHASTDDPNNAANTAVDSAQHQDYALSRRGAVDHGTEGISGIDRPPPEAEMFVHARSMLDDDRYEAPILRRGDVKCDSKKEKQGDE